MLEKTDTRFALAELPPRVSEARRIMRVFLSRKVVIIGLIIILIFLIASVFAPWIAPYDPYEKDFAHRHLIPPQRTWAGFGSGD